MHIEVLRFWMEAALLLWNIAVSLYLAWERRKRHNDARLTELKKEVDAKVSKSELAQIRAERDKGCDAHKLKAEAHDKALRRLADEIGHLPTRNEINDLSRSMQDLGKQIGTLGGRLEGINRMVDLLTQNELSGGK